MSTFSEDLYLMTDSPWARQSMYAIFGDEYSELSLRTDDNSPFFNVEDPFGTNTGGVHPIDIHIVYL